MRRVQLWSVGNTTSSVGNAITTTTTGAACVGCSMPFLRHHQRRSVFSATNLLLCDGSGSAKKRLYKPPTGGIPTATTPPSKPDLSMFSEADLDILSKDPTKMGKEELDDFLQKVSSSGAMSIGDTMPAMLQYNQSLVEATLNLLNKSAEFELSEAEETSLCALTEWLMPEGTNEGSKSLSEQYALVSSVLSHPQLRKDEVILESCKMILQAMAPPAVFDFFSLVDLEDLAKTGGAEAQEAFHNFLSMVLKGTSDEHEADFAAALKKMEDSCAWLFKSERFQKHLAEMQGAMVQCRLYELVMMACREFDPEGRGTVNLEELRSSLAGILGDEGANKMLESCEPNSDGTVFYPQMAKVLMNGTAVVTAPEADGGDLKRD